SAILDTILRAWIRGLSDVDIRKESTRGMASVDRLLRNLYNLAKEARRTKIELDKLVEEERKANKLSFYKTVVQKNMTPVQIEALMTQFRIPATENRSWSFHNDYQQENVPTGEQLQLTAPDRSGLAPPKPFQQASSSGSSRPPLRTLDNTNANPRRNGWFATPPRNLPPRSKSRNPFINGSKAWVHADSVLCVKCGELGYISNQCDGTVLPVWEQSYLKEIVFGASPKANFASARYRAFDSNVQPYSTPPLSSTSTEASSVQMTPSSSSASTNSVTVGIGGLSVGQASAQAFYSESSGPNKRPFIEQIPQPDQSGQLSSQPQPGAPFQFQSSDNTRDKKKGQKRTGKRAEPTPLVGLLDKRTGNMDSPISIRQVLKNNKVDMTWIDWMAWLPSACRKLKRLLTRMSKKKPAKGKQPVAALTVPFNPLVPGGIMPQWTSNQPFQAPPISFNPVPPTQYAP
ncbi:MAG: hypothetical protein Q9221_008958, partial [Calogaya cf. arnoldii]